MKSLFRSPHFPIALLLLTAFLIGCFTVKNYGESWDEPDNRRYGEYALNAYQYFFHSEDLTDFDTDLNFKGPAYFMLANILARGLMTLNPAWTMIAALHFVYLITFLVSVYVLYRLSLRWMSEWAAFGVALLFLTQPLLWGHALINPKDIPFMAFFMISIYLGIEMSDAPPHTFRRAVLILFAGIFLGLTTSIRILGPLAGMFVVVYAINRHRYQAVSFSSIYLFVAGIASYLTWPYLWKSLIVNFFDSLKVMSQFPFEAKILYWGTLYPPALLPDSYFPVLLALQLTEPLLVLILIGLAAMVVSRKIEPVLWFLAWFVFPTFMIIASDSIIYDNGRQLYFLLPPLFFVAGFALDWMFKYITQTRLKVALLSLAALPGIFSAVQLHPYEYAYYNSFIGGINGAVHRMETEYWGTSFKEAMEYVNSVAPDQARILILSGPEQVAKHYARPDLQIITEENDPTPQEKHDYVLILTRKNQNEQRCKNSEIVYSVERGDAIFTFVQKPGAEGFCR